MPKGNYSYTFAFLHDIEGKENAAQIINLKKKLP